MTTTRTTSKISDPNKRERKQTHCRDACVGQKEFAKKRKKNVGVLRLQFDGMSSVCVNTSVGGGRSFLVGHLVQGRFLITGTGYDEVVVLRDIAAEYRRAFLALQTRERENSRRCRTRETADLTSKSLAPYGVLQPVN